MRPDDEAEVYPGLEYKSVTGAVKDAKPEGIVVAAMARYNIPDADDVSVDLGVRRDIIHGGAFDKTLIERKGRIAHLYNHNWKIVLGKHEELWSEPEVGLMVKSQFNLGTFWGNEIFQLVRNGDVSTLSFGYLPRPNKPEQKSWEIDPSDPNTRHLYGINLFEGGPTPNAIAVNPASGVVSVKGVVFTDTSFVDQLLQAENILTDVIGRGEELAAERKSRGEGRGRKAISPETVAAAEALAGRLDELKSRLAALAVEPEGEDGGATGQETKSILLRRDLALARLRMSGINLE